MPSTAVLAGVFVASTAISINEQRKQAKKVEAAQEQAQAVDIATQNEQAARARRSTIKEAMIRRAQIENVSGATGQTKSSAVVAGTQQVGANLGENLGSINTSLALSGAGTAAQTGINQAMQTSTTQVLAGAAQQGALAFATFKGSKPKA